MKKEAVKSKKKNTVKVNFEGVETRAKVPDGLYHSRVKEITVEEGNAADYLKWVWEIAEDGKLKGRQLFYNTSLAPQALWNLRQLLETLSVEIPDGPIELDLDSYVGLEAMLRVENEVYEGKDRPKVTDFTPLEEVASAVSSKKAADDDEEESDEEEADDEEEAEESDDEEEASDEKEEEEEEGKLTAAEVREMDEKELADLIKQHKLKVDLTKITKPGKRAAAVVDALEAKGLLADEE